MKMTPEQARQYIISGKTDAVCVNGSIDLQDTNIASINCSVSCNDLNLSNTPIQTLSDNIKVRSRLVMDNCRHLESLPAGLTCGSLSLRGCAFLDGLPEQISTWFLDVSDCPRFSHWPTQGVICNGNVRLRNCVEIRSLPTWLGPLGQLDVAGCVNLRQLPDGLRVSAWIDIGGSSITELPTSMQNSSLRWRSVPVDHRIAFDPDSITVEEVLVEQNAERRRVMIERMGYLRFSESADAKLLDQDTDPGGQRQLLKIDINDDEPLVGLACFCPSTGRQYFLRVPPHMMSCHQAAAWIAGFDEPSLYHPSIET